MRRYIFIACFCALPLHAATGGATGAAFLKLGVGARGLAMGEAYTAEAGSVESLYWNPAGLVNAWRPALMFSYKPIVEDTAQSQAAVSCKYNGFGFGLGYNGIMYKSIPSYDDAGNRAGDYDASDQMLIAGAALGSQRLSAGAAIKYIQSSIASKSAEAFAADVGVLAVNPFSPSITHALVVKNIGPGISYVDQTDPLPLSVTFGNAFKAWDRLTATLDVAWRAEEGTVGAAGVEWMVAGDRFRGFALRGGYTDARNQIDGLSGVSMGAGFALGNVVVDYAWIPYGELGNSHAISLLLNIPNPKWLTKKK